MEILTLTVDFSSFSGPIKNLPFIIYLATYDMNYTRLRVASVKLDMWDWDKLHERDIT